MQRINSESLKSVTTKASVTADTLESAIQFATYENATLQRINSESSKAVTSKTSVTEETPESAIQNSFKKVIPEDSVILQQ